MSTKKVIKNAEKKFILEFIECYRSLPALWDIKSEEYNDRVEKEKQYKCLLKKYRERYPEAEKKDVTKKINSLRSNFKRVWNRTNNPDQVDNLSENANEVKCWYFDAFSFITDIDNTNNTKQTMTITPKESFLTELPLMVEVPDETEPQPKKIKDEDRKYADEDSLIKLACARLAQSSSRDTESEYLSKAWCNEFKEMASDQKRIVKKLLSDLIYYGSQGMLTGYHVYQFNQLINNSSESTNRLTPANDDVDDPIKME